MDFQESSSTDPDALPLVPSPNDGARFEDEGTPFITLESPQVLFIDDVATLFRTSRRTIDRRRKLGTFPIAELPAIDNKPRWSKAAVMRFLADSNSVGSRRRPFSGARTGTR